MRLGVLSPAVRNNGDKGGNTLARIGRAHGHRFFSSREAGFGYATGGDKLLAGTVEGGSARRQAGARYRRTGSVDFSSREAGFSCETGTAQPGVRNGRDTRRQRTGALGARVHRLFSLRRSRTWL